MENRFKENDIVACIGVVPVEKFRVKSVQTTTYRVEQIQIDGTYISSFDREWVDRDFVKVGKYGGWGEIPEDDEDER